MKMPGKAGRSKARTVALNISERSKKSSGQIPNYASLLENLMMLVHSRAAQSIKNRCYEKGPGVSPS